MGMPGDPTMGYCPYCGKDMDMGDVFPEEVMCLACAESDQLGEFEPWYCVICGAETQDFLCALHKPLD